MKYIATPGLLFRCRNSWNYEDVNKSGTSSLNITPSGGTASQGLHFETINPSGAKITYLNSANQTRRLRSDSPAELSTELTLKVKTQLARFQLLREMCNDVHSTDTLLSEEVVIEHLNYADSVHKALLKEHSYFEVTRAQGIHTS
ncbi:hypothetical protein PV326_010237 [Microctonus aethiopoides]|nr:hypothetical protein PV326_010237 [Microctonus aethiopoides]